MNSCEASVSGMVMLQDTWPTSGAHSGFGGTTARNAFPKGESASIHPYFPWIITSKVSDPPEGIRRF